MPRVTRILLNGCENCEVHFCNVRRAVQILGVGDSEWEWWAISHASACPSYRNQLGAKNKARGRGQVRGDEFPVKSGIPKNNMVQTRLGSFMF